MTTPHGVLAASIAARFIELPEVEAVALGGSRGVSGLGADAASDIDVYVYTRADIALEERIGVIDATGGASRTDLDQRYWGPGDEWLTADAGTEVDIIYFDAGWMAGQLDRVLVRHEPSLGYSTCFWHTVRGSTPLEDPRRWFAGLQERCDVPYPERLRANIVAFNHPVLRGIIPSYAAQLEKAVLRRDLVAVNHRIAALLASYFDIVLAVNRVTHPGEKRLLEACTARCSRVPESMQADVAELLETATIDLPGLPGRVDRLLDRLDAFLIDAGM